MKFSRRNGLILAVVVLVAMAGIFSWSAIYPLWKKERSNQSEINELQVKIQRANKVVASVEAIEKKAAESQDALARMTQAQPMGPPVVWFPEKLKEHLSRFGITESEVRLNSTVPDPERPEFQRTFWNVRFPTQSGVPDIQAALMAATVIEDQERFVRILDCSFTTDETSPFWPAGSINLSAVVRE